MEPLHLGDTALMQGWQVVLALPCGGSVEPGHCERARDVGRICETVALDYEPLSLALHHWNGKITAVIDINTIRDLP